MIGAFLDSISFNAAVFPVYRANLDDNHYSSTQLRRLVSSRIILGKKYDYLIILKKARFKLGHHTVGNIDDIWLMKNLQKWCQNNFSRVLKLKVKFTKNGCKIQKMNSFGPNICIKSGLRAKNCQYIFPSVPNPEPDLVHLLWDLISFCFLLYTVASSAQAPKVLCLKLILVSEFFSDCFF